MKKGILFICSTIILGCLSLQQAKAQDFDLEFYQYFSAHMADYNKTTPKDAITAWRGSNNGNPAPLITMNNISANVFQNNRVNNMSFNEEAGTVSGTFLRAQLGHNDCIIVLNSASALRKVAFQYASGTLMITYYPSVRPDTTGLGPIVGVVVMDDWRASGVNKILATHDGTIPGPAEYVDVNDNGNGATVYAEIQRTSSGSPKLYRIAASTTNFTTLPLNLLSFTAKADAFGKSVNLNWKTTNEVNTQDFTLERRTDNSDFVAIGTKPSANITGEHNYAFVDENPVIGNAYYRLKQTDKDGKFTYSGVVSVNIAGAVSVSLYPNPATDQLNLTHAAAANASVRVLNVQGKTVAEENLSNGATTSTVNVSQLVSGTYVLILNNDGKQSTLKFIKK